MSQAFTQTLGSSISSEDVIRHLPPIRLQSGEYFQPNKVIKYRSTQTDEVVGVVCVRLCYIPTVCVKWTSFLVPGERRPEVVHIYVLTTCNVNGCIGQYIVNPSLNDKCRLHCGDLIRIVKVSLQPQDQGLTRAYSCVEEFHLIIPGDEVVDSQGLDVAGARLQWWTLNRADTQSVIEALERFGFPSPAFCPLNYWFEQCVHIPRLSKPKPFTKDLTLDNVTRIINEFEIGKSLEYLNLSCRIRRSMIAVVLCVRKPVNYLTAGQADSVLPIRTVLTVADNSGSCDVVLWNNNAVMAETHLQIGSIVLLQHFNIQYIRPDPYVITHPQVPLLPVDLNIMEEGSSSAAIYHLPHLEPHLSFPDPFHNLVALSAVDQWKHNQSVSIVGVVIGISRYHTRVNDRSPHIGRSYVRRWLDVSEVTSGATVSVCLYLNRCIERHLAIRLNSIICLTHLLVKCFDCLQGELKFTSLHSVASTEIFVVPGPNGDRLPPAFQQLVSALQAELRRDRPGLTWMGGVHPFENYLLEESTYTQMIEERCWGLVELQTFTSTSVWNRQVDFVFPSRLVQLEICRPCGEVSWVAKRDPTSKPRVETSSEVVWERPSWTEDRKQLLAFYGAGEQPYFEYFNVGVEAGSPSSEFMEKSLRFPSTDVLEELDLMEEDGREISDNIINRMFYRLTFEHVSDRVAVACTFTPEPTDGKLVKLRDLLRLDYRPKRNFWDSPVLNQMDNCQVDVDVVDTDQLKPWMRMQCIRRNVFEFQLCYLGS